MLCACFVGCSEVENSVKIQDNLISRYGDGLSVIDSFVPPQNATEYTNLKRLKINVNIDARVGGYHMTGIYLPAGETLTVNVSSDIFQLGYRIYINSMYSDSRVVKTIQSIQTKVTSDQGGIVEIFIPNDGTRQSSFDITIEGGISMPYYRMGRDKIQNLYDADTNIAILDSENIRFYLPVSLLVDENNNLLIDNIDDILMWWQSAVSFFNKATDEQQMNEDYIVRVLVDDTIQQPYYNSKTKVIHFNASDFENIMNFDKLKSGSAWNLLYQISDLKVKLSDGFEGVFEIDMIVDILCSVNFVMMTNSSYNQINGDTWLNNSYTCLEKTIELMSMSDSQKDENFETYKMRAFFINIMHSFGVDKILEIIVEYSHASKNSLNGEMTLDNLGLVISDILQRDVSYYFEYFDMPLSQETVNKIKGRKAYIPVQSKYTIGGYDNVDDIGYTVPMGESAKFDFDDSIISLLSGWDIVEIQSDSNRWTVEDGIYYYSPSADTLIDSYQLSLRNGEYSATLYGRINVDIATSTYKVYEGWTFENMSTALEDAISTYEKRTPDYVGSMNFAGIKKYNEEDDNTYVLTVGEGCISVPRSGNYTIFLKNSGLCQVDFGVPKYMFSMFTNSLPVSEYTQYLSYDIELDSDKIYEYKIYMLATKGEASAVLGIRYNDGEDKNIYDIDSNYLIYKGLDRADIVEYNPPVIYPDNYNNKEAFNLTHSLDKKIISYPQANAYYDIANATDEYANTTYKAQNTSNEYVFVVDFGSDTRNEYISFIANENMVGAKISIMSASKNKNKSYKTIALAESEYTIKSGYNFIEFDATTNRYFKFVIYGDNNFELTLNDLEMGECFEQSTIVTNTSSSLSYMGGWKAVEGYVSINGSISQSTDKNSIMAFTEKCRQVAFYGVKDTMYGKMDVYVDGKFYTTIDLYSETKETDALLFAIDFDYSLEHSIKIMPSSNEDIINIDYISYIPVEKEEIAQNTGKLYYALIIPAVIVLALIGAYIADRVKKNKSTNKNQNAVTK